MPWLIFLLPLSPLESVLLQDRVVPLKCLLRSCSKSSNDFPHNAKKPEISPHGLYNVKGSGSCPLLDSFLPVHWRHRSFLTAPLANLTPALVSTCPCICSSLAWALFPTPTSSYIHDSLSCFVLYSRILPPPRRCP